MGNLFQHSLLASSGCWKLMVFLGLQTPHSNFCLDCQMVFFPVCLCIQISSFCKNARQWIRAHLISAWSHVNLITSVKTLLFPNNVTFMSTGVKPATYLYGRHDLASLVIHSKETRGRECPQHFALSCRGRGSRVERGVRPVVGIIAKSAGGCFRGWR